MTNTKVTLISVDEYGPSMGIRFLSSVLKEAGFETTVIFVRGNVTREAAFGQAKLEPYKVPRHVLSDIYIKFLSPERMYPD
ncbi:hypothetical protein QUF72_00010 [Desulfobacterales bacterium HSG2]|nr:hypothetical protein [Desulfobacterales bacterium HSG2]